MSGNRQSRRIAFGISRTILFADPSKVLADYHFCSNISVKIMAGVKHADTKVKVYLIIGPTV